MARLKYLAAPLLLSGCFWLPRPTASVEIDLKALLTAEKQEERDAAFQSLTQAGSIAIGPLKRSMEAAPRMGFPVVAALYALGEGDCVPLELRVRHLGSFRWPSAHEVENAILEPYVWNEVEHDITRSGRPALRLLSQALAKESPTEAKALHVVRVMLRIGGRPAAEEFARLLGEERKLGDVRVCDVAAGGLLYLGRQELALRLADRDAMVGAAREWWARAREQSEAEWLRESLAALAGRWAPDDHEGVRPVIELLTGQPIENPKEWWERNKGWIPAGRPIHAEELLPLLSADRPRAYDANRRLEEMTGEYLQVPPAERLTELCAAFRLWQPAPDLGLRWKRYLESSLVRMSIVLVGYNPKKEANQILYVQERYFHPTEDETADVYGRTADGEYRMYVQSRDLGTRIVFSEYFANNQTSRGYTTEFGTGRPVITFSTPLRAFSFISIDDVPARQPARPPEAVFAEVHARMRALVPTLEGRELRKALRALAYFQDTADRDCFQTHRSGEALLLLGDPSALEFRPRLEPYEIEMALRKAADPTVKTYLEDLRRQDGAPKPP